MSSSQILFAMLLVVVVVLGLRSSRAQSADAVSGDSARVLVDDGALLLDVRTPAEFAAGHIDGAVNLPVDALLAGAAIPAADGQSIVVYCRSGQRSAIAASRLRERGYTSVYDLGPMSAWAPRTATAR